MPTRADVERWRPPWRGGALGRERPAPDLSALPREEAERARRRLHQLDGACGCKLGVAIACVVVTLYITAVAVWLDLIADNPWVIGAIAFAVLIVGAGVGKTFGLVRARSQRNRLLDELHSRVATSTARNQRA